MCNSSTAPHSRQCGLLSSDQSRLLPKPAPSPHTPTTHHPVRSTLSHQQCRYPLAPELQRSSGPHCFPPGLRLPRALPLELLFFSVCSDPRRSAVGSPLLAGSRQRENFPSTWRAAPSRVASCQHNPPPIAPSFTEACAPLAVARSDSIPIPHGTRAYPLLTKKVNSKHT